MGTFKISQSILLHLLNKLYSDYHRTSISLSLQLLLYILYLLKGDPIW